jgi:uncharacterized protein (AIM24 family)
MTGYAAVAAARRDTWFRGFGTRGGTITTTGMEESLLGSVQPVLSIALQPGESIVAEAGEFSWMTDSVQMSAGPDGGVGGHLRNTALERTLNGSSLPLSTYTAKREAGTIAFATRLPGSLVSVDVVPGTEYLVHRGGFLAGTPGVLVTDGFRQPGAAGPCGDEGFVLRRIAGCGRAWVELAGDVVRRELAASMSLRAHPGNVGMVEGSVAVQVADVPGVTSRSSGSGIHHLAVLSGPGAVWLQSLPLPLR